MLSMFKRPNGALFPTALFAAAVIALGAALTLALGGCSSQASSGGGVASSEQARSGDGEKIQVVASFYPMADFAEKVGGDRVEVKNLVPAGTEPHDWEPSTADMRTIQSADLLVYNGAGMEHWVSDVLASTEGGSLQSVEASEGIDLLDAAEEEDAHATASTGEAEADSHDHGQHDPHVWLAPENAKKELENIKDALVKVDPDNQADYEANYERAAAQLDDLDSEFKSKLANVPNKNVVVSHQAFGYLCNAYGLTQMPISGMEADSEPDAKTMAQIIDFVKENDVKAIFSEDLVSPKVAQSIADATGAQCEVLNPLEGLTDDQLAAGDDYVSVMKSNLDELVAALS